jgi:GR25 family glycosyltransferase involved in LPS biosynthesis
MTLQRIKTALREWNRRRLGKRSAVKVKQQSLARFKTICIIGMPASVQQALKPCIEAMEHHGLLVCSGERHQPNGLNIYGTATWAVTQQTPPQGIFGVYMTESEVLTGQTDTCASWLLAARFIWVPSMDAVRQLVALGIASSKIYLLPTEQSAKNIPGEALFYSALHIQKFFASRFLLAHQLIGFDGFYQQCSSAMRPLPRTVCIGVVEYVARLDDFMSEQTGIAYFPGLRHTTGWVGCGMSYKFLFCLAKRDQLSSITICEDDVRLPPDWQTELERIHSKIQPAFDTGDADVFAGIVTTLPDDAVLLAQEDFGERKLVTLNKTTGTVFNVYSQKTIHYMSEWNHSRHDLVNNTIDKYLMNKADLRAQALMPFFVQHKEDIISTLWNTSNGETYNAVFDKTEQRIYELINNASQHQRIAGA